MMNVKIDETTTGKVETHLEFKMFNKCERATLTLIVHDGIVYAFMSKVRRIQIISTQDMPTIRTTTATVCAHFNLMAKCV